MSLDSVKLNREEVLVSGKKEKFTLANGRMVETSGLELMGAYKIGDQIRFKEGWNFMDMTNDESILTVKGFSKEGDVILYVDTLKGYLQISPEILRKLEKVTEI